MSKADEIMKIITSHMLKVAEKEPELFGDPNQLREEFKKTYPEWLDLDKKETQ